VNTAMAQTHPPLAKAATEASTPHASSRTRLQAYVANARTANTGLPGSSRHTAKQCNSGTLNGNPNGKTSTSSDYWDMGRWLTRPSPF
jgi:surface antigen